MMGDLMEWYKNNTDEPVIVAADLHHKFVCIHPFDDGNGRIARLLMNYHLLKNNLPPVVIKSDDKKNYLRALQEADAGDLDSIRTYIAEKLIWSLELNIKAAKGESPDELGDWEKKLDLLKKGFTSEKIIVANKSVETNKHTLAVVVISVINYLLNSIDKISTLFIENTVALKTNIGETNKLKKVEDFKDFIHTILESIHNGTVGKISIIHNLEGYKHNGVNTFHQSITFLVRLKTYSYSLSSESNPIFKIENPYLQELSEKDFDLIANEITETLLKKVEETK